MVFEATVAPGANDRAHGIHIGAVTSGKDVIWLGAAETRGQLALALSEFLLPRSLFQLREDGAAQFLRLVDQGQPERAVDLSFRAGGRPVGPRPPDRRDAANRRAASGSFGQALRRTPDQPEPRVRRGAPRVTRVGGRASGCPGADSRGRAETVHDGQPVSEHVLQHVEIPRADRGPRRSPYPYVPGITSTEPTGTGGSTGAPQPASSTVNASFVILSLSAISLRFGL